MGLFANDAVSDAGRTLTQQIFEAVGKVVWVDAEDQIDAVTALSGSGPAYFFLMLESMVAAGVKLGLEASTAETLAIQTALGAAKMAQESDVSLATLRERVTSPGGTTAAALNAFEEGGFAELVEKALRAAHTRSLELGSS